MFGSPVLIRRVKCYVTIEKALIFSKMKTLTRAAGFDVEKYPLQPAGNIVYYKSSAV